MKTIVAALLVLGIVEALNTHPAVENLAKQFSDLTQKVSENKGQLTDEDITAYDTIKAKMVQEKNNGHMMITDNIQPWFGVLKQQVYVCQTVDVQGEEVYKTLPAID